MSHRERNVKPPDGTEGGRRRLRVDMIACEGYGYCAELLPELVMLDDWGYPMIAERDVDRQLAKELKTVIRACPKLALRLDE